MVKIAMQFERVKRKIASAAGWIQSQDRREVVAD
jgi:hypothetical protein